MRTLPDDLRFGFRVLFSRPGFTAIAVLTLSLGIGVTTAAFTVIDSKYWKAFPGAVDSHQLMELETVAQDGSTVRGSWLDFREYRDSLQPAAFVAAHTEATLSIGATDQARPVWGELVSSNYFAVLGVKAALGRVIASPEVGDSPGAHPFAVISHALWTSDFQGRPEVVGMTIRVNRHDLTIIGVAPAEFRGAMAGLQCDVWVPFTMAKELGVASPDSFKDPAMRNLYLFARLAPGIQPEAVQAELRVVANRLSAKRPSAQRGFSAILEPMWRSRIHGQAESLRTMLVLMAVSLMVLMIACANVASLLLARSVGRLREFGVRAALGAGRWRIARHIFVETSLIATAGSLVGIPMAIWMTDSAVLLLPRLAQAGVQPMPVDLRVLAFAVLIAIAAALGCALAPVFLVLRSDVNSSLREGGRSGTAGARSHRLHSALIISEVALALVVLIGASLFYRSYQNVNAIPTGFDSQGVLLANLPIATAGYTVEELDRFCLRLRDRLEADPGNSAVAYADYAPLWASDGAYTATQPEGFVPSTPEDLRVHLTSVSPGYFGLLKIPLLEGRDFNAADTRQSLNVMIVNQAFAAKFFGRASPVGRRVMVRKKWFTVVGLVRDSKYFSYTEVGRPHYYLAFGQSYQSGQHIVFFVRTRVDPESAIASMRSHAAAIDPNASGFTAAPLPEYGARLLTPLKLAANLLTALAIIAFVLAGIGLYGVMSYDVSRRSQEMGIRMALGARPSEVLATVVRHSLLLTGTGVATGLALSLALMRLVASFLVGVSPFDAPTFVAASLFLITIAVVASVGPARRATHVDPATVLHGD